MLAAPVGHLTVLYDLVTEVAHVLNPSAALVWDACDGVTGLSSAVEPLVVATAADPGRVTREVTTCINQLREAGVVGRTAAAPEPTVVARPVVDGASTSAVHAVLDDGVRFHSDDTGLLAAIDAELGLDDERPVTVELGVHQDGDGLVQLRGWGHERSYHSRQAFLFALPTALNQVAASSSACIALHSGAVRSPAGDVLLLPAASGSGKTTLTAALVQAGWDYVTDEAVGVRAGSLMAVGYPKPLVLDAVSRAVLGLPPSDSPNAAPPELRADVEGIRGEAGPVRRVVLPRYEAGAETMIVELDPQEAVVGVLEHALNLRRVGQPGLEALCQLVEQVPVHRLVHGGVEHAVVAIEDLHRGH